MIILWRGVEDRMGTIDLRRFDQDQIVIHFGGELTSVDAYTFANSLVSFADTIRAVNDTINPGQNIEIRLDAVGPGSFKAVVKRIRKGLGGFLSRAPENAFWAIVAVAIIDPQFDNNSTIEVREDHVLIHKGNDTIIMPREAYDNWSNVKQNPHVIKNIQRTFETVEKDENIENFGLTPEIQDESPLVQIPREDFPRLSKPPELTTDETKRRHQKNKATVIVLKPWVDASSRKWSFEWNGVPVSAYLRDNKFMERVKTHEIRFGNGDALEVLFEYYQDYDNRGIWENDTSSFEVTEVYTFLPKNSDRIELK